jgi:hypothetical protein
VCKGHIPLVRGSELVAKMGDSGHFEVVSSNTQGPRTYFIRASSPYEAKEWVNVINEVTNGIELQSNKLKSKGTFLQHQQENPILYPQKQSTSSQTPT